MFDCIVIGTGPAGYTAAVRAKQLGGEVCIIERDLTGGVCTNWGCIPTKAMITAAKAVESAKAAKELGILAKIKINFKGISKHRDRVIKASRDSLEENLSSYGINIIRGEGKVISGTQVSVGKRIIEGKNIVIATGSVPTIPGFIKLSKTVISSKELVTIKKIPESLIIIGGGVIGLEFATLFSSLGTKITIIEMFDRILFNADPEVSEELSKEYKKKGIKILTRHKVISASGNIVEVESLDTQKKRKLESELILVAIGRHALVDAPALDKAGIKYDKTGIIVNERMQTSLPSVYAVGDSTGKSMLAHAGIEQATVAAENIMGKDRKMDYTVPACIYTMPEVAMVGEIESSGALVGRFPFSSNARARCESSTEGFVKAVIKDGFLVGVHIIGHNATEMISEGALAVKNRMKAKDIIETIHAHPTYAEALKCAIEDAYHLSVDQKKK
ncbi:MAG: dihydrolipoyl dehydrogenase [Nanoarchaeota archaeon]|nr:dihydrolipoyl dehydrogenase [Nanoarchaeota archaeon]